MLKNGRPEWAVIPYGEYERLMEAAENMEDIRDYNAVKKAIGKGSEELVPSHIAEQLLNGENSVRYGESIVASAFQTLPLYADLPR